MVGAPAYAEPPSGGRQWFYDLWEVESAIWAHAQGDGVTVAVLDSGVQADVPDLAEAVLPGADFTGETRDGREDSDPDGHGTAMASIIAAAEGGAELTGLAPQARILPVNIGIYSSEDEAQVLAEAIRWAGDNGADVISMSIGMVDSTAPNGCPTVVQDAVTYVIEEHDTVVVAATGNEGADVNVVNYPASCRGVVGVGAVNENLRPSYFSQRRPYVDLAAPGESVFALNRDGELELIEGTSPATALVSASVALLRSAYPEESGRQVVSRLLRTLVNTPPPGQRHISVGFGVIDPAAALATDSPPADVSNPIYDEIGAAVWGAQPYDGPLSTPGTSTQASTEPSAATDGTNRGWAVAAIAAMTVLAAAVLSVMGMRYMRFRSAPKQDSRHNGAAVAVKNRYGSDTCAGAIHPVEEQRNSPPSSTPKTPPTPASSPGTTSPPR